MALAVEAPAREDLSLRTNNDTVIAYRWMADPTTPVPISSVAAAFRFDPPPTEYDEDTGEPIPPVVELHIIDSTTPDNPDGWIDATQYAAGYIVVHVSHTIWAAYTGRRGTRDVVAVAADTSVGWRCLAAGRFCVEEGIS